MTALWQTERQAIRKMRVRSTGADPLNIRLRLGSLFQTLDLRPYGLPASSILCVRSFRDPLPGRISVASYRVRPPESWERAAVLALSELEQSAVHPYDGLVPASTQAVVFRDTAELMACLARDSCDATAGSSWWWRGLFEGGDLRTAVLATFYQRSEFVPAAMYYLAAKPQFVPFIQSLMSADLCDLIVAIARVHQLPAGWRDVIERASELGNTEAPVTASRIATDPEAADDSDPPEPWSAWAPEACHPVFSTEQKLFTGFCLTLQRARAMARRESFIASVRAWVDRVVHQRPERQTNAPDDVNGGIAVVPAATRAMPVAPGIDTVPFESPIPERIETALDSPNIETDTPVHPAEAKHLSGTRAQVTVAAEVLPAASEVELIPPEPNPPSQTQRPVLHRNEFIETSLGGLFFLVNLGLFLKLYGDFTKPAKKGIELPIWDFLDLLGHALLADNDTPDRVWSLLAELAGRNEDQQPGAYFNAPLEWCIDPDWLVPFEATNNFCMIEEAGRRRVWHPAGFLISDRSIDSSALEADSAALDRWIWWITLYARARLRKTLGLEDVSEIAAVLLRRPAKIYVTPANVDVIFSLSDLPVSIRLAGLDRNPGWVPAAGRVIAFYFE